MPPITLDGSLGITTPMYNGSITANAVTPSVNMKNRIINGAMVIDQRNAGASITPAAPNQYTLDRWKADISVSSKYSAQQSSTAPTGFVNSLLITSLSAYTVGSAERFCMTQNIEGLNVFDLSWGTANAKTITLSFWVRSSLTGTFGGAISNSAQNRSYPFTYTISSANTFEQKTITITGDTSGTWLTTSGIGLRVIWGLGVGSTFSTTAGAWTAGEYYSATGATSVVGTNGATFYITGVQLEVGSTATSFDYRPYGTELALCQRYLPAFNSANTFDYVGFGFTTGTTNAQMTFQYYVPPRVAPTGVTNSAASGFSFYYGPASHTVSAISFVGGGSRMSIMNCTISGGPAGGTSGVLFANSATAQLLFTGCEL